MKKFLAVILTLGLCCVPFFCLRSVAMAETSEIVHEKVAFAQAMDELYSLVMEKRYSVQSNEDMDIQELISKTYFASGEEKEILIS